MSDQFQGALISLVSVFVVWLASRGWQWLHRPTLTVDVGRTQDFISKNPLTGANGESFGEACYVRLKLLNRQWHRWSGIPHTARRCVTYLAGVDKWDGENFRSTIYADYMPLTWSHNPGVREMDVSYATPHWVDLCRTEERRDKMFFLETQPKANRYQCGFSEPGPYRFTIQITAEGIEPKTILVYLQWPQNWELPTVINQADWEASQRAASSAPATQPT